MVVFFVDVVDSCLVYIVRLDSELSIILAAVYVGVQLLCMNVGIRQRTFVTGGGTVVCVWGVLDGCGIGSVTVG